MVLGLFLVVRPKGQGVWALIPGVTVPPDIHPFPIIKSSNIFRYDLERSPTACCLQSFLTLRGSVTGGFGPVSGG